MAEKMRDAKRDRPKCDFVAKRRNCILGWRVRMTHLCVKNNDNKQTRIVVPQEHLCVENVQRFSQAIPFTLSLIGVANRNNIN
uniref:hypothetical protein n=1 Tax=Agathobacter sp. TaxID=2021311 RepID=UPI004055D339